MSPKEMVALGSKASAQTFGIKEYHLPTVGNLKKTLSYTVNKSKAKGPIEAEAKKRSVFPGAGQYTVPEQAPWEDRIKRAGKSDFSRAKRVTLNEEIGLLNKIPEKSTPAPSNYSPEKKITMRRTDVGGTALKG